MHSDLKKTNFGTGPFAILINLDHEQTGRNGTHWVGAFRQKKGGTVVYYDSYGLPPSDVFINAFPKNTKIMYNNSKHQQLKSNSCGLFVLKIFKLAMEEGLDPNDIFYGKSESRNDILDNFPSDRNESIVRELLE